MKKADLNDTDEELDLDFSDDEEYVIKKCRFFHRK